MITVREGGVMLALLLTLWVLAAVSGLLGFTGIAVAIAGVAKIVFYLVLISAVVITVRMLLGRSKGGTRL